jgi:hypothetical protein
MFAPMAAAIATAGAPPRAVRIKSRKKNFRNKKAARMRGFGSGENEISAR